MLNSGLQRVFLFAVLGFYFLAVALYMTAVPLFEAPDEYFHFAVIAHLAQTGQLPPLELPPGKPETTADPKYPWRQMTFHAPLYYLISAALVNGQDTAHFGQYRLNPHAQTGIGTAVHNINFLAHVPGNPTDRAAYMVQGFSIILGAVTVTAVFQLGRTVFGDHRWSGLLPALIAVTNPQYLFISSVITNDTLVTALTTLTLLLLVTMLQQPFDVRRLLLALAALSKASGLLLYPTTGITLFTLKWQRQISWRKLTTAVLRFGAAFVLIVGWWYLRNWQLWGDPTATTMVARTTGLRSTPVTFDELGGLYYSFWGVFGWFNLQLPTGFFTLTLLLIVISAGGWLRWLFSRPMIHRSAFAIAGMLGVFVVLFLAAWWHFNSMVLAAQGRLWFPLLGVIAVIIMWGIVQSVRAARWIASGILVVFAMVSFLSPILLIRPAYQPDAAISAEVWQAPPNAVPFEMTEPWQEDACLRLWIMPYHELLTSQIAVDMQLETFCPVEGYWSFFVHFVDLDQLHCTPGHTSSTLRQFDTMPQGGKLPFPAFVPGTVVADTLVVDLPPDLEHSGRYALHIGLYDAGGGSTIRAPLRGEGSSTITPGTCSEDHIRLYLDAASF